MAEETVKRLGETTRVVLPLSSVVAYQNSIEHPVHVRIISSRNLYIRQDIATPLTVENSAFVCAMEPIHLTLSALEQIQFFTDEAAGHVWVTEVN